MACISPVATGVATAAATSAWPCTSSGMRGSSIQPGSHSSHSRTALIALAASGHALFASRNSGTSGPTASLAAAILAASSRVETPPTLILTASKPRSR